MSISQKFFLKKIPPPPPVTKDGHHAGKACIAVLQPSLIC